MSREMSDPRNQVPLMGDYDYVFEIAKHMNLGLVEMMPDGYVEIQLEDEEGRIVDKIIFSPATCPVSILMMIDVLKPNLIYDHEQKFWVAFYKGFYFEDPILARAVTSAIWGYLKDEAGI